MPAVLSDRRICDTTVPIDWKPVLDQLSRFVALEKKLRGDSSDEKLSQQIIDLHDQLLTSSAQLLEPHSLDDVADIEIEKIFARSVFLMTQIAKAVAGDDDILDTAGSRVLHLYGADFYDDDQHVDDLRTALKDSISVSEPELVEIEKEVRAATNDASRKQKIVRALRDRFHLWQDDPQLRRGILEFFEAFHPNLEIPAQEIEVIVTGTMIFFCLPFDQDGLTTERFQNLPSEKQEPVRKFLQRVNRFSQWQFAHFPVFGFRRGKELDDQFINDLASETGLEASEVVEEVNTLTAIVTITDLDKYVAHDLWGHSWQACMLQFDHMYQEIARYADPLSLDEQARGPDDQHLSFADCFVGDADQLRLDESTFRRFVDLEVAERLPVAMTPVLAEVLADVAEFKPQADRQVTQLPTTSQFKSFPAKLDLTLQDVPYYFRQATKSFRLWAKRSDRQARTVQSLVNKGATESAAQTAVQHAVSVWNELEADRFSPEMNYHPQDNADLKVNVICRLMLNFLGIHRETITGYDRIANLDTGRLPIKGFRDLMLIAVAVFFEDARARNLWRVDEFVSLRIEPLCERLAASNPS